MASCEAGVPTDLVFAQSGTELILPNTTGSGIDAISRAAALPLDMPGDFISSNGPDVRQM
ncbi:hypothetical protein AO062_20085 [Variovorax boronicumulans]|nr:hypothetical protein AO062_20085 [Variovorax boronicumulans]